MLEYDRADGLCNCIICHYCYFFLEINVGFQPKVCDGCHNLMQNTTSFNDVTIFFVQENDCRSNLWYMSKVEGIKLLKNGDLIGQSGTLKIIIFYHI